MRFTNFKILQGEGSFTGELAQVHGDDGDIWFAIGRSFLGCSNGKRIPMFEALPGNCFAALQDAEEEFKPSDSKSVFRLLSMMSKARRRTSSYRCKYGSNEKETKTNE